MSKKLLAIGGPKKWEWLPFLSSSYDYKVVLPRDRKSLLQDLIKQNNPFEDRDLQYHTYRRVRLGFQEKIKDVYISEDLTDADGLHELKEWLLGQFVNMDDPDDTD